MDTVQQDAFATRELLEEGGDGLMGLARALLEAGVNEMVPPRQTRPTCPAGGAGMAPRPRR